MDGELWYHHNVYDNLQPLQHSMFFTLIVTFENKSHQLLSGRG